MRGSPLNQRPAADPAAPPWAAPLPGPGGPGVPGPAATGPVRPGPVPAGAHPAATAPTAVPSALPSLDKRGSATRPAVDPQVARELKRQVAAELHQQLTRLAATSGTDADRATRRQRGRALIEEAVARWSDAYAQTHGIPPTREQDRALSEAVFDLLFRAGRLQPYLDDPDIENILINGCDDVWISRVHQPLRQVPPVADSDEELIELLQDLARQHGGGERSLSTASPTLALRLEGGMRLQAMTEVTPRPYVAIRRHRVASATLSDLVQLGTVDPTLAAFLAAAIRARKNVMITGTQGVGKTSLLRAMAAEIPPDERIGTLESEFELWLHTLGHLRQVVPMEAREGNGERVEGRMAGELTIGELIPAALRMTLSRIIVGEVRSGEVVPMLRVMTNGEGGSMCTLHARGPHMVVDRIAELCLEYGSHMTDSLAYRLTANAIDLIVHVTMVDETAVGGRRHRFVSHVLEVAGLGEHGRPALNTVFGPRTEQGEPRAVPHTQPNCLDDLRRAGFDASLLQSRYGTWAAPLHLRIGGAR
ncbi:ATP/GTP-binding protein [Kitasatospora herbaricolor]|uniref:CpaF family protein n=1 Tax=Kitasatospora herbaricolor TaxID=68217 RepID=UPI0019942BB1|nr:CpaF/VirB11 family protein [Kitasatospora herbaricolor]MDQ0311786.1 Flp pilus assembly CpaF family ATPase [Kitasatospora herbaricolor]GGU96420.1 ATP/GTP-binding protein [Kitasatospora herbaricolor]